MRSELASPASFDLSHDGIRPVSMNAFDAFSRFISGQRPQNRLSPRQANWQFLLGHFRIVSKVL